MSPVTLRLLAVVSVLTAVVLVVDAVVPIGAAPEVEPVEAGPVVAGGWYCAAAGSLGEDVTQVVTAAPRTVLEPPSEFTYAELLNGSRVPTAQQNLFGDQAVTTTLSDEREAAAVEVRWFEHPAAVTRVWRRRSDGVPSATVSGPCASGPDDTWYVPGLSTAGGASATLHIANPFASAASVGVVFLTPEGEVDPVRLRNQVVPANGVLRVDVNEFLPRQGDLAAVVTARSGRVVTEAVQQVDAAIGGVNGLSLAAAAPEPGVVWTIPWSLVGDQPVVPTPSDDGDADGTEAPTDDGTEDGSGDDPSTDDAAEVPVADGGPLASDEGTPATSWVWVANPSDTAAAVSLTLHAPGGPVVPELGEELEVGARSVLRIALDGLLPEDVDTAGVTVTSNNDVPVVVSLGTVVRLAGGDERRTGYSVQAAVPAADVGWVLSGPSGSGGVLVLHLTNPGADPALVDVVLWDGAAAQRPPNLQGVTVAPGTVVELPVDQGLLQADTWTAFVTATEGQVVAGARSFRSEAPVDWVVQTGIPAAVWRGGGTVPTIVRDAGLVERLGTDSGAAPTTPTDVP